MLFFGTGGDPDCAVALSKVAARRDPFDDKRGCFFGVSTDPEDVSRCRIHQMIPGIRYFLDHDRSVSRLYGACPDAGGRYRPYWLLLDRSLRVAGRFSTRIERLLVACYEASSGGHFRSHRDNTTLGTAHRRFAVTINLNAGEYDGGDLRFPEFGARTYRAPTGGAIVFSCSLLHEATTVTKGRRFAFLPFLYDEAGALLREQNAKFTEGKLANYRASPEGCRRQ